MPAYIIVELSIHDPKGYEEYKKLTPASIKTFGGRFLIRAGKTETLEGNWTPERIVAVEFPNAEVAKDGEILRNMHRQKIPGLLQQNKDDFS